MRLVRQDMNTTWLRLPPPAGLFATKTGVQEAYNSDAGYGLFYGGNVAQLGIQLLGAPTLLPPLPLASCVRLTGGCRWHGSSPN